MIVNQFTKPPRVSYQAPGNPHDRRIRIVRRPKPQKGAAGGLPKQARKDFFLLVSATQGDAIAKQKADKRAFRQWFEGLSPADQEFARTHNLHKPMPAEGFRRGTSSEDALDQAGEHEIIPEADVRGSRNGKPIVALSNPAIDAMEPVDLSIEVQHLSPDEIATAAEDFELALRWALTTDPDRREHELAQRGERSLVIIAAMRSDLARGLEVDPELAREFLGSYDDFRLSETIGRLQACGQIYDRVLEWLRRGTTVSAFGERLQLIAYELRPDLIDAATLAKLGEPKNKTRAALDKDVNCLRDTFAGLRALVSRSITTRLRCQAAQLS